MLFLLSLLIFGLISGFLPNQGVPTLGGGGIVSFFTDLFNSVLALT